MHTLSIRRSLVAFVGAAALITGSVMALGTASAAPLPATVNPDKNHISYWVSVLEDQFPGVKCTKYEDVNSTSFTVPAPDDGYDWVYAIVKAGANESVDEPFEEHSDVSEGDVLTHSSGKTISHVILCQAPSKSSTTTTSSTTSSTTSHTTSGTTSPSTGPVVETDITAGTSPIQLVAWFALLLVGVAMIAAGVRRPARKH